MNDTRVRHTAVVQEKKKDPLFRLKDGSEKLVFKVKDPEIAQAMVSKMRDKTLYLCEQTGSKFRSTSKNSSGLKFVAPTQKSSGLVSLHQESSIADKTSRDLAKGRGEFAIRSHKNSFRFKTQE